MGKTSNLAVLSNTFDVNASGAVSIGGSAGTAGQVLTSQGSGAAPQWAGAGFELLATINPSASAAFAQAINLPPRETFLIMANRVGLNASDPLQARFSNDNGSSYSAPAIFSSSGTLNDGFLQIFRCKTTTTGSRKPLFSVRSSTASAGDVSLSDAVNAIKIEAGGSGSTFTGAGYIYIFGMG